MTSFFSDPDAPTPHESEPRLLTREQPFETTHRRNTNPARPTPPQPPRQRRRITQPIARRIAMALFATVALLLLLVVVFAVSMRRDMRAALPQIDGTLQVPGLSAAVRVERDASGVPSIQAASVDDVLFAQGYVTAQDRLWQMDVLRRHGAGELAEILGSRLVPHDRLQRTLQMRVAADRAIAALPPDQLHQLEAYARGVNAFIDQNKDRLPVEFHLLHYKPAPWSPRDSLLVELCMFQDLGTEYTTKLSREVVSAHLPPQLLADLYPVGSWRDHPPLQTLPDLTSPKPEIQQVPLDETQTRLDPPSLSPASITAAREAMLQLTCEDCRSGSNNWAVAGSRSASGLPLVSNDMHLALNVPDIWYEASLHTADNSLDVAGVTLPGIPFVIVGRNAHVAWGFTNLGGDVQDIYIEHTQGAGPNELFEKPDGTWAPLARHVETIVVRGGRNIALDVLATQHKAGSTVIETPVISGLFNDEHRTLSLAWTPYDPANLTAPFLAVNQASTGAALVAALSTFGGPSLNLVYGDDGNHIGYHAIGRIPIRGAAIHHPVATPDQPPVTTPGEAPPENGDESRLDNAAPHLITAAYHPARSPHPRPAPKAPARSAPAEDTPPPAAPAPPSYTIGSPIPPTPVDALSTDAQWTAYIPFEDLPSVIDPATGFVATANARVTPDGYPYAIALDWISSYRIERIIHLLASRSGLTSDDMLRTQMDIHSEMNLALAQRFAYALDHSAHSRGNARLKAAADILRSWNGDIDATSSAADIVAATRGELWRMLLVPQIEAHDKTAQRTGTQSGATAQSIARLYTWGEQGFVLEDLVTNQPARWLPPSFATWEDFLATAVERALKEAHAPGDLASWQYGRTHPVEIDHPLISTTPLLSRLLGVAAGSGPRATSGDASTVKSISHSFGPSERFTADLSSRDSTRLNITTGQSGNPASPWYLDQLPHWLDGTTLPLPLHNAGVAHTLTLEP